MRVTERSRLGALTLAQNRASERLDRASRVASSGQRVVKPSDDPAAYGALVRRNHALAMLDEHSKIATRARGELVVVESSLSAGVDIISRAMEAAIAGANSTSDSRSRQFLAEDVRTMREELLALANTRYADKYVFGGTKTDAAPFDTTTGAFLGNDQVVRVPVMEGVTPPSNISGATAFTVAGGRDIFADLEALATALATNDEAGISGALAPLTLNHAQLVRSQVEASFGAERFAQGLDVLMSTKAAITEQLSKEIEGDPSTQITELSLARTAYERSIAVTKQILSISST